MKLVLLLNVGKGIGGGSYSLYKFFEKLSCSGHDVIIFGMSRNNHVIKNKKINSNLIIKDRIRLNIKFKGSRMIDNFFDKIYTTFVLNNFLKNNKDIDFICGYLTKEAVKAADLGKKFDINILNFVYESPPWMKKDLGEAWDKEFDKTRELWEKTRKAYLESDVLLSTSNLSKQWCDKWLSTKKVTDYIYPGIDLIRSKEKIIKKNQIIYMGRLDERKNIDKIIKALSLIKNPPRLIIAGGGDQRKYLEKLSTNLKVDSIFTGKVSEEKKWKLIRSSKFMVFASSHEGFGMPPMEALACEIPCICSDKPIFKEVYEDKVEYFKENDIDSLKEKIEFLLKNPDYCEKRGKQGRKYIEKKFSWKKSAEKIERILKHKI
ncbi:glycosyltransferase [Candidatus Woesearchaeota archaeon]|nr:glycosyltransferase [Candidatus Woesearchaeota archaeon]